MWLNDSQNGSCGDDDDDDDNEKDCNDDGCN